MKTLKYTIAIAVALSASALTQTSDPSQQGGRFIAANYGRWQAQVVSFNPGVACVQPVTFTLYNNLTFKPWNVNASILIGFETVTPTSFDFVSQPGQVCISAPYVLPHFGGDTVKSGTAGLQEALNVAGINGGVVTIDSNWSSLGGTNAIKAAAVVPGNVGIEDARVALAGAGGPVTDKGGQVYNVKAYGALGNGVANDFTAINSALTACGSTGGQIYFPPGTYISASQLVLPAGCYLVGATRWSSIIKAASSLSANTHFIVSNNFAGTNCSGASFTSCPTDFGMWDISIDANCGAPTGVVTPCTGGGGRGVGTGNAVAFSGYRWILDHVGILNSPNDGLYSEISGGTNYPAYNGGVTTDGNAAHTFDVRIYYANHNGFTDLGPPDSVHDGMKILYSNNNGLLASCTANSACASQSYFNNLHVAHTNTGNGCEVEVFLLGSSNQCESTQTSGTNNVNIDEGPNVGTVAQNFGQLSWDVVDVGDNNGSANGLRINSPQATNSASYPVGNDIKVAKIWATAANGQTGFICTASAIHTTVDGSVGGNTTDISNSCAGQNIRLMYTGSGTDVSVNQWKGGNTASTVCGAEINSAFSPQSAVTGNAADIILVNCSIPAWVNQVGHKCTYRMQFVHTGAASLTWKIWFGQTAAVGSAPSGGTNVLSFSTTQAGGFFYNGEFAITNYIPPGGSTCSVSPCLLNEIDPLMSAAAASLIASSSQLYSGANQTLGAAFNLSLSFNVANTDTATFKGLEAVCY